MKPHLVLKKLSICFLSILLFSSPAFAATDIQKSEGETIYVPVYSNVFSGEKAFPFHLAAMLSIRNVDINNTMKITTIDYHNNDGKILKNHIDKPIILAPLASTHIFIKESDEAGGFGANFIVRWEAAKEINAPIVESIMIGARSGQGVSFKSQGQVITE